MNQSQPTSPENTSTRRHVLIIIGLILLFVILEIISNFPQVTTPTERLELSIRDTAFRLRGTIEPNPDFVIIAIDDQSLNWRGTRWPWSRAYIAEILDYLIADGASIIALDFTLFDPSEDPQDDIILAETLSRAEAAVSVNQIINTNYTASKAEPLPIFKEVLDGWGITEIERDDDAIVRSINAYKEHGEEVFYNWAFEIASLYMENQGASNPNLANLTFGDDIIPLNQQGRMLIDFAGPAYTYPTYPASYVSLDYPEGFFEGKVIFFGATSETLQDLYPTPFSSTHLTPGVEIVANTVDTLVRGKYMQLSPPWVTILILVGMGLAAFFIIKIPQPTYALLTALGVIIVYFVIRQIIFTQLGWHIAVIAPSILLFLGVIIPTLDQAVTQELEKRRVHSLFSRFISPTMVEQLIETQDISSLNKRTELTILFSDIRSFTTISEKLLPEEVVALLNPYLQVMSEIIHKHGGTVDKYEGDAIVAFFGEPIPHPDHARRAALACLDMREELKRLTDDWNEQGLFTDRFEMGVGLNTGEVFVGMLGSEERINYTIIGDAANLAARLQDQTKEYDWPVLISGTTWAQIKDDFTAEFVDSKLVKGKTEPVDIYKLTGEKDGRQIILDKPYNEGYQY